MSIRSDLAAYLATVIAGNPELDAIKLVPSVRDVGALSKPTLIIKTDSFEKIAVAPRSRQGNFTLTLVSPHANIDSAEDQLDELLEPLLPALFTAGILWTEATQVAYGEPERTYLAYDIRISSILSPSESE